jgi:hypothetical protein
LDLWFNVGEWSGLVIDPTAMEYIPQNMGVKNGYWNQHENPMKLGHSVYHDL